MTILSRTRLVTARIFAFLTTYSLLCLAGLSTPAQALGQVTTYHYNNARTGATANETVLTTSNVNVASFGKAFSLAVDGQVYAQPLYLPSVAIPQMGTHNVVYVATEHNSVYAFDADAPGSPLWQVNLGPSMPWSSCCMQQDLLPEIGITSTPVIDATARVIYVLAESLENNAAVFRLHALDATTGQEVVTPVVIQGNVPGNSFAAVSGILAFAPKMHYQRPGLLLANGNVYVGFGSHQDTTPFYGWLFSYNAATLAQTGILCLAPDNQRNGIWQGGAAPAVDASGNIYLETGDGPFDVNTGGRDYGDSVVKVGTSGTGLTVLDYFAPSSQLVDDLQSWDFGSSGPLLIPGTSLGVAGGKDGKIYVFNTANLGQFNGTTDQVVQEWQATFAFSDQLPGGFFGGSFIFYNSTLYGFAERDSLKAFSFNGSQFNTTPVSQSTFAVPTGSSNDPAMSISSNNAIPGTGIVWAAFSADGVADGKAHPGVFYAFDAADVSQVLWNSNQNSTRDAVGNWAKWNPPVVANGKVYLGTYDNSVDVYGLLSTGPNSIAATAGTLQSTPVGSVFATALQATVTSNSLPVSGVTVTFTAPASGAGATFSGLATATAVTNTSGVATAPALTANGMAGFYSVTASTPGAVTPANFGLTNLAGAPASITASAGTPQSAAMNTAFATALQATVKDAGNNPLSGVTVVFTAPASGAGAFFAGSGNAAAVTNISGVATAPALTANGQTGTYAVVASVNGLGTVANFNLTNLQGVPASVTATAGTPQSATVLTNFGSALQVMVKDAGNNLLSGVTVTFTTPSSGASASFSGSATTTSTTTATTNAAGVATAPALTANNVTGSYTVTASVAGSSASAGFTLTNTAPVGAGGGTLTGSGTSATATANLTAEGNSDWAHWGDGSLTRKSGVSPQVSDYTVVGSGTVFTYNNDPRALTWTDGTPTGSATNNNGIYINDLQNGFSFTVPADTGTRTLTVHVGGWMSGGTLTAHLSDLSAADYVDSTTPTGGQYDRNYTLTYKAASAGQTLTVSWVTTSGAGNVTLNGAALTGGTPPPGSPTITATAGTPQSAAVLSNFGAALQVTVKDAGNNPLSGVTVAFNAPSSGAGASFSGSATTTAITNASGVATAPALTANGQPGTYAVTASVAGVSAPATFNLTNLPGAPASIAATAGTPQSATVLTNFGATLQVTVKDAGNNLLSGVNVTFTAPSTGAGASFSGSSTTTAISNASGVATAPALTANGQAGAYAVTASVAGVSAPATFNLTNLTGAPASVTATAGTPQSATVLTNFGAALQVMVKDAGNNLLGGVNVTFTAPASGPGASFGGSAATTAATNGAGVATAPALTANNAIGSYTVTATIAGLSASAGFTLTNTAPLGSGGGALTGSGTSASATANLTTEGASDWVHWGDNSLTRKTGVTPQVSNYTLVGFGTALPYNNDPRALSWTDGTPTASATNSNGLYINSLQNGFSFTAPADTGTRTLSVYVGGWLSGGTLTAHLSDWSAADFVDSTTPANGQYDRNYTLTYKAASAGQTLTVSWVATSGAGNVTLNGAALAGGTSAPGSPASVTATAGTPQSATVLTNFGTALQVTVKDAGNNLLSGVNVTFTAPASGASASFGASATTTAATNAAGVAAAPALTANNVTGSYSVAASVAGLSASAAFTLTNTAPVVTGGGALTGSGTSAAATANLTTEGTSDWAHWGDGSLTRKAGVTPQLSDYAVVGAGTVFTYNNDPRAITWTDGTPTGSATNNNGIYINNLQNGFSFTAPADTGTRTLTVHVGGWMSGGTLTAHLSDLSAADFADSTTPTGGQYDRNYTLTYKAASAGQTLTVSWVTTSGAGNVTLNGAALTGGTPAPGSPTIAATAGTPQSVTVGTTFAAALQATVTANSLPASGVTVTFTAPGSGAGATFSGSATATAITNASGVATAPLLTANGLAGSYTVTASAPGAGTANFSLTNLAGAPASIAATAGTPQTATINTVFPTLLQATVSDAGNNPLGGVTVTFTAPSGGAGASFAGSATATAVTNASGVASAPALTANGQIGTYTVVASAAGVPASAAFSLTNALAPVAPITLVQQAQIDSMINIQSQSLGFASPNTAGNWIGVAIFGGQSNTHQFTVTDSNGNTYKKALTQGNTDDNITLGMYYAENINGGPNTVKVVPDTSGYLRVVIVEYSGVAKTNSLDVTASAQGNSIYPNSGNAVTTANGDLLLGASASADADPVAGPGYTLEELVPRAPGTALSTEDQIQTTAGTASASLTLGSAKDWTMGLAAFKKAQ